MQWAAVSTCLGEMRAPPQYVMFLLSLTPTTHGSTPSSTSFPPTTRPLSPHTPTMEDDEDTEIGGLMAVRLEMGLEVVLVVVLVLVLVLKGHHAHHNRGFLGDEVFRLCVEENTGAAVKGEGKCQVMECCVLGE
ncbi:hypothetical protein E2C01_077829 [Portunus trituberculatus]|uniref:Uncharacterized protein n=1 Tax=Portunus trituberculatus TaxID=210409 RepID=A0A5B7INA9_PORTR|nr:hypothetical protein [Portunus trituberculatus]